MGRIYPSTSTHKTDGMDEYGWALALALAITQAGSVMATVSILCAFFTIIEFCESEL